MYHFNLTLLKPIAVVVFFVVCNAQSDIKAITCPTILEKCQANLVDRLWTLYRNSSVAGINSPNDALEALYDRLNEALQSCDNSSLIYRVRGLRCGIWRPVFGELWLVCFASRASRFLFCMVGWRDPCTHASMHKHACCITMALVGHQHECTLTELSSTTCYVHADVRMVIRL